MPAAATCLAGLYQQGVVRLTRLIAAALGGRAASTVLALFQHVVDSGRIHIEPRCDPILKPTFTSELPDLDGLVESQAAGRLF